MKRNHSMISWAVLVCFVLLMVLQGPVLAINHSTDYQPTSEKNVEAYLDGLDAMLTEYPVAEDTIEIKADACSAETAERLENAGYEQIAVTQEGAVIYETEFAARRLFVDGEFSDSYGAVSQITEPYSGRVLLQYDTVESCYQAYEKLSAEGVNVTLDEELDPVECFVPGYDTAFSDTTAALGYDEMQKNPAYQQNEVVISYLGTGVSDVFNNGRLVTGTNVIDTDTTDTTDIRNHDTGCTTVIFDSTPSNVKVMPVRFYNTAKTTTTSAVVAAYWYGLYHSDILCTSVIFTDYYAEKDFLDGALAYASANNKPVCISAGNQSSSCTKYYPNNQKESFSALWVIGGVAVDFSRYSKSNYSLLDFSSMAVNIHMLNNYGNSYTSSGTSMSAPYVAAAAAMLMASGKYTTIDSIYGKLQSMCMDLGTEGYDAYYGWGVPVYTGDADSTPVHVHKATEIPAVPATCTAAGLTAGEKCSECGEILKAQTTVPALGHSEKTLPAKEATCSASGLSAGTQCSRCGVVLTAQKTIPALGHDYQNVSGVPATCTTPGMTSGKQCTRCGDIQTAQNVIPALGHSEVAIPGVSATCTSSGLTAGSKCSRCGEILVAQKKVVALGHDLQTLPAVEATCTTSGLTAGTKCKRCDTVITAQKRVAALGHQEICLPAVDATCTESGLTEGTVCNRCNEVLVPQETIEATGHVVITVSEQQPTCTEAGKTQGSFCAVCGTVIDASEMIPPTGHREVELPAVEATCTEPGLTAGVKCEFCDEILSQQMEIPALGHQIEGGNAIEPTCTEPGLTAGGVCSVCGYVEAEQQVIPALGHHIVSADAIEPTCTEKGMSAGGVCTVCGYVETEQIEIPALGHTVEVVPAVAPTCTQSGLTEGECCTVCGETLVAQEEIPATGHKATVLKGYAPTCTKTGLTEGSVCDVCGVVVVAQEIIPATGHSPVTEVRQPTETKEGFERITCKACGETLSEKVLPIIKKKPVTTIDGVSSTRKKITVVSSFQEYVRSGGAYRVTGHGFVYISKDKLRNQELTVNTSGRTRVSNPLFRFSSSFTYTFNGNGTNYVVRSWISYVDENGKTVYAYSDPITVK